MPYGTLKYLQRKGRNQVPAATSGSAEEHVRRLSSPPNLANKEHLLPDGTVLALFETARFDIASFRPLEFFLAKAGC